MELKNRFLGFAVALTVAAGLVACGSGEEGSTVAPRALMVLDATNAEGASSNVYDGLVSQQASGTSKIATASASSADTSVSMVQMAQKYLTRFKREQAARDAVTTATVYSCGSSAADGTVDITDTSIVFTNCRESYPDGTYDITNGSVSISGLQQSGNLQTCTLSSSAAMSFNNLTVREYDSTATLTGTSSIDGGMSFTSAQATVNAVCETTNTMAGSRFVVVDNAQSASFFDFNIAETTDANGNYSVSYLVTMDISSLPGSLRIETLAPIVGVNTDRHPATGHIRITGDSSVANVPAIVDIEIDSSVVGGEILLTVDVDGTVGVDYTKQYSWAEFEAL